MYRIKEEQEQGLTIYKMQEGYVRKYHPVNGFGIAKEVVWMTRVKTTESDLAIDAYKAAQMMSSEDFKLYAQNNIHQTGIKKVAVETKLDQAAFDLQQLEAKMIEQITDLQLEAKKYKELKEIASTIIHMIDRGAILQTDSIIVQALRTGLND